MIDALVSIWLMGGGRFRRKGALAALVIAGALGLAAVPHQARAGESAPVSDRDMDAALSTRLAYVVTGDASVDETSKLGLEALTRVLAARTSAELAEPVGLDPARDELAFYPLIYWPIVAGSPQPKPEARTRIAAFMKNGGTMIFDTRDALIARPGAPPTAEALWLRTFLKGVDVPELEPVPRDHVLTKTFYLLDRIVGRTAIGQTWVEALPPPDPNDHVGAPRAPATAFRRSSSPRTISRSLGGGRRPAPALAPRFQAGRGSASLRCAAASIWSCTRSPAITRPTRSTRRTSSKG